MHKFKDARDRSYELSLQYDDVVAVKNQCGVDLLALQGDNAVVSTLFDNPTALIDVLTVLLCKEDTLKKDFRSGIRGDAIDAALDALIAEVRDFLGSKRGSVVESLYELAKAELESGPSRVRAIAAAFTKTSGDLPESVASTPDATPTGN